MGVFPNIHILFDLEENGKKYSNKIIGVMEISTTVLFDVTALRLFGRNKINRNCRTDAKRRYRCKPHPLSNFPPGHKLLTKTNFLTLSGNLKE